MRLEIAPEPTPDEERALAEAFSQRAARAPEAGPAASAWWRAGVHESVAPEG
jgi:hypothetical protein